MQRCGTQPPFERYEHDKVLPSPLRPPLTLLAPYGRCGYVCHEERARRAPKSRGAPSPALVPQCAPRFAPRASPPLPSPVLQDDAREGQVATWLRGPPRLLAACTPPEPRPLLALFALPARPLCTSRHVFHLNSALFLPRFAFSCYSGHSGAFGSLLRPNSSLPSSPPPFPLFPPLLPFH